MRHHAPTRRSTLGLAGLAALAGLVPDGVRAQAPRPLAYDDLIRGPVPILPAERALQTVVAEPWFKVSDEGLPLEGPAFDRAGNLLFVDAGSGRVFRLAPDMQVGPGHHAAIISLVSSAPRDPSDYKARLAPIHELSHITIEVARANATL